MRKKNGFTLIELLAVIVILAIIALIAVPQIMKILNQARLNAAEDSTYGIYNATQDYISKVMLSNGGDFPNVDLTFTCDTTSCKLDNYLVLSSEYNLEETLDYKGKKATEGKVKISSNGTDITIENLKVNEFYCNHDGEKAKCGKEKIEGNNTNIVGTLASNVHIGDYIEYDPTLGVTDSSLLSYTSPIGELKIKDSNDVYLVNGPTNYSGSRPNVTYNEVYNLLDENGNFVTTGYTVEVDNHGNGWSDQSFTATSSNNVWRVLDVNETTGVVKIIPEYEIKTSDSTPKRFYMTGLIGYKNAKTELNNISSIFGYGIGANGAQSITFEEVNALTGYTPASASIRTLLNRQWYNSFDYYYYGIDYPGINTEEDSKIYEMLFKRNYPNDDQSNRGYFLVTPCVLVTSSYVSFNLFSVRSDAVYFEGDFFKVKSDGTVDNSKVGNSGVLPVVSLQSSVNYKSGDGTSSASDKIIKFQ